VLGNLILISFNMLGTSVLNRDNVLGVGLPVLFPDILVFVRSRWIEGVYCVTSRVLSRVNSVPRVRTTGVGSAGLSSMNKEYNKL